MTAPIASSLSRSGGGDSQPLDLRSRLVAQSIEEWRGRFSTAWAVSLLVFPVYRGVEGEILNLFDRARPQPASLSRSGGGDSQHMHELRDHISQSIEEWRGRFSTSCCPAPPAPPVYRGVEGEILNGASLPDAPWASLSRSGGGDSQPSGAVNLVARQSIEEWRGRFSTWSLRQRPALPVYRGVEGEILNPSRAFWAVSSSLSRSGGGDSQQAGVQGRPPCQSIEEWRGRFSTPRQGCSRPSPVYRGVEGEILNAISAVSPASSSLSRSGGGDSQHHHRVDKLAGQSIEEWRGRFSTHRRTRIPHLPVYRGVEGEILNPTVACWPKLTSLSRSGGGDSQRSAPYQVCSCQSIEEWRGRFSTTSSSGRATRPVYRGVEGEILNMSPMWARSFASLSRSGGGDSQPRSLSRGRPRQSIEEWRGRFSTRAGIQRARPPVYRGVEGEILNMLFSASQAAASLSRSGGGDSQPGSRQA